MHRCLWNEPPKFSEKVGFTEFEWKYHIFLSVKTGEWDLNVLLFNCWNDLVLGSVETYFLEVGAYVSLKLATTGVSDGHFCWIWVNISSFFKYKKGRVGPKNFAVELLKWSCLRLSIKFFSGSPCTRVCGTSQNKGLRGLPLLNLSGDKFFF